MLSSIACLLISSEALLAFEYVITLDRELELIWERRTTGASVLFMLTRYTSLIAYGIRATLMARLSCGVCRSLF